MIPSPSGRMHSIGVLITRNLAGLALAVGLFRFVANRDLQEGLIPFLLVSGALVAIVAGKPAGWLVAAFCLWGLAIIDLVRDYVRDYSVWGTLYNWDFFGFLLHQEVEQAEIVIFFSIVLMIGGLVGWSISIAAARLRVKRLRA
jgi:hypothetical protein